MKIADIGRPVFCTGMAGLGLLSLIFRDFALQWQPVSAGLPAREALACVSGVLLLVGAAGILFRPVQRLAAWLLVAELSIWVLMQLIALAPYPKSVGAALPLAEDIVLLCGAASLVFLARMQTDAPYRSGFGRGLRIVFGLACLVFGVSHFIYAGFTSQMIPAWLPFRLPLAYLTGAGHFAAGLGLIFDIVPRLAAVCEAAMMSLFVILVHVTMLLAHPAASQLQLDWTMLFVACALAGTAWIMALLLDGRPWGLAGRKPD